MNSLSLKAKLGRTLFIIFVRFLIKTMTPKSPFEINWPLEEVFLPWTAWEFILEYLLCFQWFHKCHYFSTIKKAEPKIKKHRKKVDWMQKLLWPRCKTSDWYWVIFLNVLWIFHFSWVLAMTNSRIQKYMVQISDVLSHWKGTEENN